VLTVRNAYIRVREAVVLGGRMAGTGQPERTEPLVLSLTDVIRFSTRPGLFLPSDAVR